MDEEIKASTKRKLGKELYCGMLLGTVLGAVIGHIYGVSLHKVHVVKDYLIGANFLLFGIVWVRGKALLGKHIFGKEIKPLNSNSTLFKLGVDGLLGLFCGTGLGYACIYFMFGVFI